jgi:hypothetical protein
VPETVTVTIDKVSDEKEEQSDSKPKVLPDNKESLKSDFEAEKKAYHVKELEK